MPGNAQKNKMAKLERTYIVPLRREWLKAPKYNRAKKAGKALKEFLVQHMKADIDKLKIGKHLNELIWSQGIRSPPHHVKITAVKEDDGTVKAELFGFVYEGLKKGGKKEEKKETKAEKKAEKKEEAKKEKPTHEKIESKGKLKAEKKEEKHIEEKEFKKSVVKESRQVIR